MSSDLSSCQRDIDIIYNSCRFILGITTEKCCVMRFARKKSSIERLDITQFGSYYVRGMGLPFVDSCSGYISWVY